MKKTITAAIIAAVTLIGIAVIAQPHAWPYSSEIDDKLTQQVSDILTECQKIKPGMTRADLMKVFRGEGGLYSARHEKFVVYRCPFIKVDVEFKLTKDTKLVRFDGNQDDMSGTDTITTISKPYLEGPISD
jgi:hypothetical protein